MSVLIKDAFRILSESYVKISEIATESLDLVNSPAQPEKNDQLIQVSMLYSIVSDVLILNDAGTAIIGTKNQSIPKINSLLLKLKKAAGIYTLPVFATPLTSYEFNFGSNNADFDITAGQLGDLIVHNGTVFTNFNKGPDGYVLVSTTTGLQWQSVVGNGIPSGGTTGQILKKNSNTPYDVIWDTLDPTDIGVSASAAELNKLSGALWSTAESNTLVGITTSVSIQDQLDGKMGATLPTGSFFVGQANLATAVAPTGDVTFDSTGLFSISALSIVNGDVATNAAIGRSKLASGSSNRLVINNSLGVMTDAAAITANEVLVSNADGIPIGSGVTTTQFAFYDISSSLQGSLDARLVVNLGTLAQGDLILYNGSEWINLALGTSGQVLTSNGTTAVWGSAAANGLPSGGTAGQFLTKIDGTNYNATWSTLTISLVTDITASAAELNILTGATFSVAEANTLVGMGTTPIQSQLNNKLSNELAINSVWVGGGGNTAQQVSAGADGSVFTIVSGTPTWQAPPTPGNVSGPVSSTDNAVTRWNSTGGNSIQDSGLILDDSNNLTFPTASAIRTNTSAGNTLLLQAYDVDGTAYVTFATLTANNTPTFDLNTATTIGTAYVYRVGGTDVSLADGGTGASLSDPSANSVMVWDDTLNQVRFALLSGLSYDSGTNTLTASGGGGGITGPGSSTDNALVRWDGAGGSAVNNSGAILDDTNNLSGIANVTLTAGSSLRTSTSDTNTLLFQAYDVDGAAYTTFATLTAGNTPTMDLNTAVTIGTAYIYRVGGTDISLADGGTGASLADPGADRIMFWDDSSSTVDWLTVGTGLTLTTTTLSADAEYIQDSVGNILVNTTTINLTYTDGTPSITADVNDGSISDSKLRTSAALSVIGRSANSIGNVADIAAGADYNILRRSGTSIGFGVIDLSQSGAVGSSVLPFANGGTGLATLGTALQYLRVNAGATALEYATIIGGSTGAVDNTILRADGTGGSTLQSSPVTISDTGNTIFGISGVTTGTSRSISVDGIDPDIALLISSKNDGAMIITGHGGMLLDSNQGLSINHGSSQSFNISGGTGGGELRILEPSGSGTNYNAFKTAAQAADITYTLPTVAPAVNGYVLSSTTAGVMSWIALGSGTGDVVGPASAADNALARFDTTTGKLIQNTPASIDDTGNLILGNSSTAGSRSISVASSDANEALSITSKGTGNIFIVQGFSTVLSFGFQGSDSQITFAGSANSRIYGAFDLQLHGGSAGSGSGDNGGDVVLLGGVPDGVGLPGNIVLNPLGGHIKIQSGADESIGRATLVGGTVTVNNTKVTSTCNIYLTSQVDGGTPDSVRVSARSVGTSFTITSTNGADTSEIGWLIVEQN